MEDDEEDDEDEDDRDDDLGSSPALSPALSPDPRDAPPKSLVGPPSALPLGAAICRWNSMTATRKTSPTIAFFASVSMGGNRPLDIWQKIGWSSTQLR